MVVGGCLVSACGGFEGRNAELLPAGIVMTSLFSREDAFHSTTYVCKHLYIILPSILDLASFALEISRRH